MAAALQARSAQSGTTPFPNSACVTRTSACEDVGWSREILLMSTSLAHRVGLATVQSLHPTMPPNPTAQTSEHPARISHRIGTRDLRGWPVETGRPLEPTVARSPPA